MMGSTLAALIAGYRPKMIPIETLTNSGSNTPIHVTSVAIPEKYVIRIGIIRPTARPISPPVVDKTTVSIRN